MVVRSEIKKHAKSMISGKIFKVFVMYLVYMVATYIIGIFAMPISYSLICSFVDINNGKDIKIGDVFEGYNKLGLSLKFIGLTLVIELFVFFWSLLFIIPGIVKTYSYSAAVYIYLADPKKGILECISESRRIMYGHKTERFVLDLSFIPNILLIIITFGIYSIYFIPYQAVTLARYYQLLLLYEANVINDGDVMSDSDNNNDSNNDNNTYDYGIRL